MGTTTEKLQAILNSKTDIKSAIESKGVSNVGEVLSNYSTYINSLPSLPSSEVVITGSVADYAHYQEYGAKGTTATIQNATTHLANSDIETLDLSGVTSIGRGGFGYSCISCPNLTTIRMPINSTYTDNMAFSQAFKGTNPTGTISIDYSNGDITKSNFNNCFESTGGNFNVTVNMMETISDVGAQSMNAMFLNSTGLKRLTVTGLKYHLMRQNTNAGFGTLTNYWTYGCTNLTSIEWPDIEVSGLESPQSYSRLCFLDITNTNVRTMSFPKLRELRFVGSSSSPNLVNGTTVSSRCTFVTDWYFPQLTVIGRYGFSGIGNTTFHFSLANKTTIESLQYYSTLFGASGSTAVFDL